MTGQKIIISLICLVGLSFSSAYLHAQDSIAVNSEGESLLDAIETMEDELKSLKENKLKATSPDLDDWSAQFSRDKLVQQSRTLFWLAGSTWPRITMFQNRTMEEAFDQRLYEEFAPIDDKMEEFKIRFIKYTTRLIHDQELSNKNLDAVATTLQQMKSYLQSLGISNEEE